MPDIPFMRAHGHVPGPTQRPTAAGIIDGIVAGIPAVALLWISGALDVMSRSLKMPESLAPALQMLTLAIAGTLYGRVFGRAANDRDGGWLFGMSYGFLVWMLGPATLLQWVLRAPVAVGRPALMLFVAHLIYGMTLGFLFPHIHTLLQRELE